MQGFRLAGHLCPSHLYQALLVKSGTNSIIRRSHRFVLNFDMMVERSQSHDELNGPMKFTIIQPQIQSYHNPVPR